MVVEDVAKASVESPAVEQKIEPGHDVFGKDKPKAPQSSGGAGQPKQPQEQQEPSPPIEKKVVQAAKDVVGQKKAGEVEEEPHPTDHTGVDAPVQGPGVPPADAVVAGVKPEDEEE